MAGYFISFQDNTSISKSCLLPGDGHIMVIRAEDLARSRKLIQDLATRIQYFSMYMAVVVEHDPDQTKPHPSDRYLLGMVWRESVYVDKALPIGLRSVPLILTAIVDKLQWMMQAGRVSFVNHYIR